MKIKTKLLFINLAITAIILISSTIALYSVVYSVLISQQKKILLNSSNNFLYSYYELTQEINSSFDQVKNVINDNNASSLIENKNIDFVIKVKNNLIESFLYKNGYVNSKCKDIKEFLYLNPNSLVFTSSGSSEYVYGKILTNEFLNNFSSKIHAEIAFISQDIPSEISNENNNQIYLPSLINAFKNLKDKNDFDLYIQGTDDDDIIAYKIAPDKDKPQVKFLIFSTLKETSELRNNIKYIILIIGFVGIVLTFILSIFFTQKLRDQIGLLAAAASSIKKGNFNTRLKVKGKDEFSQLSDTFNIMLDEIEKKHSTIIEYSDFITLINKNPSLKEVSASALSKIINVGKFEIGALYLVEDNSISVLDTYGVKNEYFKDGKSVAFLNDIIKNKIFKEIHFEENAPVIKTGLIEIAIKYLYYLPVIYHNEVIGILELGSSKKIKDETELFLKGIQEQLAIGLANAAAFSRLETLVNNLKELNEDYQKQNEFIKNQNVTLVNLHSELKVKAEELEVQKQKAEELTKLKSQFLASISHELRTPMNSILGLTDLMYQEKELSDKTKDRLQVVLKSGKRLMNLINDILDLSKIESGKMEYHKEDFIIDDLLKDISSSIKPLVDKKELDFRIIRKINTSISINSDRGKIAQVLLNLLGNAVKFTDSGYIKLVISSLDNKLCFNVIDTGIGIKEEEQKFIFDEFRQLDGSAARKYNGTGLGLSISKKMSELMKGELKVESKFGKGSNFIFIIPLVLSEISKGLKIDEVQVKGLVNLYGEKNKYYSEIDNYFSELSYRVNIFEDEKSNNDKAILSIFNLNNKINKNILEQIIDNGDNTGLGYFNNSNGYYLNCFGYLNVSKVSEQLTNILINCSKVLNKKIKKIVIFSKADFKVFTENTAGIKCLSVEDIHEFYKVLENEKPEMVFTDLVNNEYALEIENYLYRENNYSDVKLIYLIKEAFNKNDLTLLASLFSEHTQKEKTNAFSVIKIIQDELSDLETIKNADVSLNTVRNSLKLEFENTNYSEIKGDVLIVDDDPETLFTLNEIVQACKCNTLLAKSGKECLRLLENSVPDLILLDIMMPEMDGFQTLTKIRQNAELKNVPVYAVTAKAMLEDKEIILRHGFDDYITKPVNTAVMAFKINKVFTNIDMV